MGLESHLRMPLSDWHRLQARAGGLAFRYDAGILRRLRAVKSEAEIARIRAICGIAGRAFARVPEIAGAGVPLDRVFRRFQMLGLEEGADWVPYLAGGAGPGAGAVFSASLTLSCSACTRGCVASTCACICLRRARAASLPDARSDTSIASSCVN